MRQRLFVLICMYIGLFQVQAQTNNIWFSDSPQTHLIFLVY